MWYTALVPNAHAKDIALRSWRLLSAHYDALLRYGLLPSALSVLAAGCFVTYQFFAFRSSGWLSEKEAEGVLFPLLKWLWEARPESPGMLALSLVALALLFISWFFVPMLCSAAVSRATQRILAGETDTRRSFRFSLRRFFPLFELEALRRVMSPISFFTEWSFLARNVGPGAGRLALPALVFFGILSLIGLFFLLLCTPLIVQQQERFIETAKRSAGLVLDNIGIVFRLVMLFLLIELRVLINAAAVVGIPLGVLCVAALLSGGALPGALAVGLAVAFGLVGFCAATYISAVLFVFGNVMWTVATAECLAARQTSAE